jgi:hypothetical protein
VGFCFRTAAAWGAEMMERFSFYCGATSLSSSFLKKSLVYLLPCSCYEQVLPGNHIFYNNSFYEDENYKGL